MYRHVQVHPNTQYTHSVSNEEELAFGPFTNYVYKRRGVGGPKSPFFVNVRKVENVNRQGLEVKKSKTFQCNL